LLPSDWTTIEICSRLNWSMDDVASPADPHRNQVITLDLEG
jgi:hypothetical protein